MGLGMAVLIGFELGAAGGAAELEQWHGNSSGNVRRPADAGLPSGSQVAETPAKGSGLFVLRVVGLGGDGHGMVLLQEAGQFGDLLLQGVQPFMEFFDVVRSRTCHRAWKGRRLPRGCPRPALAGRPPATTPAAGTATAHPAADSLAATTTRGEAGCVESVAESHSAAGPRSLALRARSVSSWHACSSLSVVARVWWAEPQARAAVDDRISVGLPRRLPWRPGAMADIVAVSPWRGAKRRFARPSVAAKGKPCRPRFGLFRRSAPCRPPRPGAGRQTPSGGRPPGLGRPEMFAGPVAVKRPAVGGSAGARPVPRRGGGPPATASRILLLLPDRGSPIPVPGRGQTPGRFQGRGPGDPFHSVQASWTTLLFRRPHRASGRRGPRPRRPPPHP